MLLLCSTQHQSSVHNTHTSVGRKRKCSNKHVCGPNVGPTTHRCCRVSGILKLCTRRRVKGSLVGRLWATNSSLDPRGPDHSLLVGRWREGNYASGGDENLYVSLREENHITKFQIDVQKRLSRLISLGPLPWPLLWPATPCRVLQTHLHHFGAFTIIWKAYGQKNHLPSHNWPSTWPQLQWPINTHSDQSTGSTTAALIATPTTMSTYNSAKLLASIRQCATRHTTEQAVPVGYTRLSL